jgi:chemotaxis response regulator CheB
MPCIHIEWQLFGETYRMIDVFLVEDQDIIRRGLKTLITTKPDLKLVGEAVHGNADA